MFSHCYLCSTFPTYKIYSVYFALEIGQNQSCGDSEKITRTPLAPVQAAFLCLYHILAAAFYWSLGGLDPPLSPLPQISASAALKSYKFLSFGQVRNCNDSIVFTLPTSRKFTTPSYFTKMREKPQWTEALWATSKRCIVQWLFENPTIILKASLQV